MGKRLNPVNSSNPEPHLGNWAIGSTKKAFKTQAEINLRKIKAKNKGKKFILVPHPSGHGFIEKEVKDEG